MRIILNKPKCTDKAWEGRADCVHCAIRNQVLFADIPEEDLDHLVSPIKNLDYPADTVLYHSGEKSEAIYTIRQGLIKLVQYLPNGSMRTVRLLGQNDVVGIEGLLGEPYHHTAIALQEVNLCQIPLGVIVALEKNHPKLLHQLMLRLQRNLDVADQFITEFSTGTAESRIARLLLSLGNPGNGYCFNHIGREDIASILGITTETASRVMADLRRRDIINCISGLPCNCKPDKLRLIADS
jgi:CRP-like cAMP-binding protein